MNKRHINFYCDLSLLFFCNINETQLQSFPITMMIIEKNNQMFKNGVSLCFKGLIIPVNIK
jgi:hypothetical protein